MDAPDMYRGHSIGRAALNKTQGIEGEAAKVRGPISVDACDRLRR
jgi:hypothetical protein